MRQHLRSTHSKPWYCQRCNLRFASSIRYNWPFAQLHSEDYKPPNNVYLSSNMADFDRKMGNTDTVEDRRDYWFPDGCKIGDVTDGTNREFCRLSSSDLTTSRLRLDS